MSQGNVLINVKLIITINVTIRELIAYIWYYWIEFINFSLIFISDFVIKVPQCTSHYPNFLCMFTPYSAVQGGKSTNMVSKVLAVTFLTSYLMQRITVIVTYHGIIFDQSHLRGCKYVRTYLSSASVPKGATWQFCPEMVRFHNRLKVVLYWV